MPNYAILCLAKSNGVQPRFARHTAGFAILSTRNRIVISTQNAVVKWAFHGLTRWSCIGWTPPFNDCVLRFHGVNMAKVKNCEWCGSEFEDKHRDGKRFCGRSCASHYRNAAYGNPQTGKNGDLNPNWKGGTTRTCMGCGISFDDADHYGKQYCTRSCASKHKINRRVSKKASRICPTCNGPFIPKSKDAIYCRRKCYIASPSFTEKQGERNRGKSVPEHARQAVSLSNTRRNAEQEYTSGRNGHYNSPKAGNIFYRSSYERIAYELLDNDIAVIHYQPEPFVIEYANEEGNTRRYRPDILINKDSQTILVEVKPEWKLTDPKTLLKIEAGKQFAIKKGWVFEVWTEKELGI